MAGDELTELRTFQRQLMRRSLNTIKALCDEVAAEIDAGDDNAACDNFAVLVVITDQLAEALVDYALKRACANNKLRELFDL